MSGTYAATKLFMRRQNNALPDYPLIYAATIAFLPAAEYLKRRLITGYMRAIEYTAGQDYKAGYQPRRACSSAIEMNLSTSAGASAAYIIPYACEALTLSGTETIDGCTSFQ